jgi:peptidoglycan pentaglycine glycine transferase (the first glycine)
MRLFTGSPQAWNSMIASLPLAHLLQTWEWSQVKTKYGWQAMPFVWEETTGKPLAAAMVLRRRFPIGGFAKKMCVLYVPKGPLLDWSDAALRQRVLNDLQVLAKRQGAIFIKLDPDLALGRGIPLKANAIEFTAGKDVKSELQRDGWRFSQDQIQFRNTVLVDLSASEDEMLARMKQKTRYNIRLAQRQGVKIRVGTEADLPLLYRMYAETSVRDGFPIREEGYYQTVWRSFCGPAAAGLSTTIPFQEPLVAEVEREVIAAVSIFYFAGQVIYLFGMSRDKYREKMPNHLLQWEAMRRAKAAGGKIYNLWGAPDDFNENDGLWGVFRFKEGFGGYVLRTIGAWDFTPSPLFYKMYTDILPRLMDIMRRRGNARTRQLL